MFVQRRIPIEHCTMLTQLISKHNWNVCKHNWNVCFYSCTYLSTYCIPSSKCPSLLSSTFHLKRLSCFSIWCNGPPATLLIARGPLDERLGYKDVSTHTWRRGGDIYVGFPLRVGICLSESLCSQQNLVFQEVSKHITARCFNFCTYNTTFKVWHTVPQG